MKHFLEIDMDILDVVATWRLIQYRIIDLCRFLSLDLFQQRQCLGLWLLVRVRSEGSWQRAVFVGIVLFVRY